MDVSAEALLFFDSRPGAVALYAAFDEKVRQCADVRRVQVKKTQISYFSRYMFACVSLLPVGKAKDRPRDYITVTFGLDRRLTSPRIVAACEPYPNRWTHHVLIASMEDMDEEFWGWIREAAVFAMRK